MAYEVRVHVWTSDYSYWNVLKDENRQIRQFATEDDACAGIEAEIAQWPNWDEGRKSLFRGRCKIQPYRAPSCLGS